MKKIFALLLAAVMVLGLFACAPSGGPSNNPNNPNSGNNGDENVEVDLTPIVFPLAEQETLVIAIQASEGVDDLNRKLAANVFWQDILNATNVKVEFKNWNVNNIASLFQTGDMGDLIINGASGNDTLFQGFIAQDLLIPIEQYIDSKDIMPNAHKYMFEEMPEARGAFTAADGHIYAMGAFDQEKSRYVESFMWINKAWLDKANLPVPTNFEEFETALEYFNTHDMNGNSIDDEIPLWASNPANYGVENYLGMWGIATKDGTFENYVHLDDDTVYFAPSLEIWKDFIKKMNEWFEAGILYEGVFTDTNASTATDKWKATAKGEVRCGVVLATNQAEIRGGDQYVCLTPFKAQENVEEVRWYINPMYMGGKNIFSVPKGSSNPKLACAFMDLFYTPENTIRALYGEADSIWRDTKADGTFTVKVPSVNDQEAVKFTAGNCFDKVTWGHINFPYAKGTEFYAKFQWSEVNDSTRNAFAQYQEADVINKQVWPRPYFTDDGNEALLELRADIFKLVEKKRGEWIQGEKDIDAEWEDFLDDLDASEVEELVDAMQEAYDVWKAGVDKVAD